MTHANFRTDSAHRIKHALLSWLPMVAAFIFLVVASSGCATTRLGPDEVVITDSTTRREVQRLVSVSVPGDSASLRTRIQYDEKTGLFKPVTIYSHSGHTNLAFTLDPSGHVSFLAAALAFTTQVPVVDTEVKRATTRTTTRTVVVEAPKSRFVKFCIGFTIVLTLLLILWIWVKLSNPFQFITRPLSWLKNFIQRKS